MKKFLSVFLAGSLSLTLLCSCGAGSRHSDDESSITPDDINVNLDPNISAEIEIMVPGGNINERTMIQCLIDKMSASDTGTTFKDLFPNVTINMSYVSVDNYVSAVGQQQLAGTLPDIVWSNSPDFYDLVESKTFIDLKPYIEANNGKDSCSAYLDGAGEAEKFSYTDDFYTEFFDMGSVGEKCYVIPRSCDSVVTFINTEILTNAGVDLDPATTKVKNGWTWDDFMEVCAQVRTYMDNNGMRNDYVFDANLSTWLSVCYPMLLSYGAEVLDENGNVALNSEATVACLELVKELVSKRYINDSTVATSGSYDNGKSAMLFQSASVSLYADRKALKGKVDLVSFPLIQANNTPKIGAGVAGYAINSQSKNKEVAWAFLTFMLSEYGQQRMAENGLNLASIRKDLSDPSTANWGKDYRELNLSAYTWGAEYKTSTDFFTRTKLSAKAGIQQAIKQMFTNASNAEKAKDINAIISSAVRDINDAMIDY